MTDDEDIARGIHAQQILDDPLVVETFAALEGEYTRRWRASPDPEEREAMWLLLQNLDVFRDLFGAYLRKGQMAVAKRDQHEKAQQAMRQDADT